MPDPIKLETQPVPPVAVTIIGTGDGKSPSLAGTIATTPGQQPNLLINVVTPFMAIMVRFGNTFCVAFSGALAAGGLTGQTGIVPHGDIGDLIKSAALIALITAGVGMIKDSATVFSGLEKKFPLASGSV